MKAIYSLLILILFAMVTLESYSQTYLISQGGTVTTCSGTFYDSGGATGNYSNDEDFTMTFKPATSGAKLQFVFSAFNVESHANCGKDYLRIYNGENTSAPVIGTYCGTTSPGTVTATNATGALTFVFSSNRSAVYSGWAAAISCTIPAELGLWTGAVSIDWNTAANWYNNFVPLATTNVTIPATAVNWPTYTGNLTLGTTCNDIAMDGSSELTVTGDFTIGSDRSFTCNASATIRIGGNFTRNGTFTHGTSTVNFFGNTNSTISGASNPWVLFSDDFETNKGWTLTGEFQRGAPLGLGGSNGNPDPTSAYSGLNVLGVDLTGLGANPGDYEPFITNRAYQAISPTINCSGYTNIVLNFQRWLGVQKQDSAYIDISINNGATWTEIWKNNTALNPTGWSLQTLNISNWANNQSQVKIRFCMGKSNQVKVYCGWNIDDLQIIADGANVTTFYDLVNSKNNAELITAANVKVNRNFTVKPGAWMTNGSGRSLYVGGDALLEASSSGMASFIDNGGTMVNGTSRVQQYLTSERWHMVGSPISDATINTYYDIYLKYYVEPTNTWTYLVLPVTIPMNIAQGYSAWASNGYTGTTTVTYTTSTGKMNDSEITVDTLNYTPGAPVAGFNLMGNPYPCALTWNSSWPMTNLNGWMQIYDNGVYRGYHIDGTSYNGGTPIIPSTQGFWIRAIGADASITIPKSQRVHDTQAFYKQTNVSELASLSLFSTINGMKDEAMVVFSPDATLGFDISLELEKFDNVDEAPTLYTLSEGKLCGVNYLPPEFNDLIIPVGFKTGEAGIYQIGSPSISNFPGNIRIFLEDIKQGNLIELDENSNYEFDYSPLDEQHRFNLIFKDASIAPEEIRISDINIYSFQNTIYVRMPVNQNASIVLYDLMGREISNVRASGDELNTILVNHGSGYYLVKVQTDEQIVSKKVFIR
jgi:hypothetical protein